MIISIYCTYSKYPTGGRTPTSFLGAIAFNDVNLRELQPPEENPETPLINSKVNTLKSLISKLPSFCYLQYMQKDV